MVVLEVGCQGETLVARHIRGNCERSWTKRRPRYTGVPKGLKAYELARGDNEALDVRVPDVLPGVIRHERKWGAAMDSSEYPAVVHREGPSIDFQNVALRKIVEQRLSLHDVGDLFLERSMDVSETPDHLRTAGLIGLVVDRPAVLLDEGERGPRLLFGLLVLHESGSGRIAVDQRDLVAE